MKKETKNKVVFTFRLEKSTLDELEYYSNLIKIDKTDMLREAIEDYLDELDREIEDDAIEDYVNLRIDEEKLKSITKMKVIPKDLQAARMKILEKLMEKKNR